MKANFSFKSIALMALATLFSLQLSARKNDGQLVYNSLEENGVKVGQMVYKKEGNSLSNYMKYNYKYDNKQRMIESEMQKWNASLNHWENNTLITYTYEGKTVTTSYHKWDSKKKEYVLQPEMTVTMDYIHQVTHDNENLS